MAQDSGSGVKATSPPRMLKVQATPCGSDSTTASSFSSVSLPRMRASLSSTLSPARAGERMTTGAVGAAGRSSHTASSGLLSTATSVPPALVTARRSFSTPSMVISQGS